MPARILATHNKLWSCVAMTITPVVITAQIFSASSFELLLHLDAPTLQMEDRELSHTEENVHP